MFTAKVKKTALSVLSFLLSVCLLTTVLTLGASAYPDNPSIGDMASFPAPGAIGADAGMANNFGHIGTLYATGHVTNNSGTIDECNGAVSVNDGRIGALFNTVGTNFGTIERLDGASSLTFNARGGTVLFNRTQIESNSGSVAENHGEVSMYGGSVELNGAAGRVLFSGAAGSGSVVCNKGTVTVSGAGGPITIASNEGTLTIDGGEVTVGENSGKILLIDNATLHCTDNVGTIDVSEDATVYISDCKNNYGTVTFPVNSTGSFSYDAAYLPIVFDGDDGGASVAECASVYKGVPYTRQGAALTFSLPFGYECVNPGAVRDEASPDRRRLTTYFNYGDSQYTVRCRRLPLIDGDGDVTIADVTALLNHLSGLPDAIAPGAQPDLNRDGSVDVSDVTALLNYLAGAA